MSAAAIARDALERIAARGVVVRNTVTELATASRYSDHYDRCRCRDCWARRCSACGHVQTDPGPCLNRDCSTAIARKALEDMRLTP